MFLFLRPLKFNSSVPICGLRVLSLTRMILAFLLAFNMPSEVLMER